MNYHGQLYLAEPITNSYVDGVCTGAVIGAYHLAYFAFDACIENFGVVRACVQCDFNERFLQAKFGTKNVLNGDWNDSEWLDVLRWRIV